MNATRTPAPRHSRTTNIVYWVSTVLVALLMLQGGIAEVMRADSGIQVMRALGYPDYFTVILGVAKLLGTAAILLPVPRTLREWAYAGFTFDTIGAFISLAVVGPRNATLLIPLVALAFVQASYWSWRRREGRAGAESLTSPLPATPARDRSAFPSTSA
jgi:uncharacterized membrane protein YphA (DoxX/SURF4 family)